MKTLISVFRALVICAVAICILPAYSQQDGSIRPSHLAAATKFMQAMGVPDDASVEVMKRLTELHKTNPKTAERIDSLIKQHFTLDTFSREISPVVAELLDERTCLELAEFWEGPIGKKAREVLRVRLVTGQAPALNLTKDEEMKMHNFEKSPAVAKVMAVWPTIATHIATSTNKLNAKIQEAIGNDR